jgi:hypothetical protein
MGRRSERDPAGASPESEGPLSPYQGLEHFTEERSPYFFGRTDDVEIILANLLTSRLTVLYGASGVGKTSALLAGVLPRLRAEPYLIPVVVRDWQSSSFHVLVRKAIADAMRESLGADLTARDKGLDDLLLQAAEKDGCEFVLIFDQFEEYFRSGAAPELQVRFEAELAALVNRVEVPVRLLLSMREDSLALLDRLEGRIPVIFGNCLRLAHLDWRAAEKAIRLPLNQFAEEYNKKVTIDDPLVELLLDECAIGRIGFGGRAEQLDAEASTGTAVGPEHLERIELPFLQLILHRLWQAEVEQASMCLRLSTLDGLGGVGHVVRRHLDQVLEPFTPLEKRVLVTVFDRLVTPSGSKVAYSQRDLEELVRDSDPRLVPRVTAVLRRLVDQTVRVLRELPPPPGDPPECRRFELLHDVLGHAVLDWLRRTVAAQRLRRAKRRIWLISSTVSAAVLLVLAAALYWNYLQWLEARPWGRLTSLISGRDYQLAQDIAQIGRPTGDTRHLPYQVPLLRRSISRFHLTISKDAYAVDMRSLFGTTINGKFLRYAESRQLQNGDLIVLGGTAAFRYQPIEYQPWDFFGQFLNGARGAAGPSARGWGLLIDGRTRRVTSLIYDEAYVTVNPDGSVELSTTAVDNAALVVRRRHFPGGVPYAILPQTIRYEPESQDRCGDTDDLGVLVVRSRAEASNVFGMEDLITVEDIADGRVMSADMKKGDYCYGRFPIGDGEELFWLYDPVAREQHGIHGLAYVAGDARFHIIPVDPGVESDGSSAAPQ